jgi:hypothetical protein
MNKDALPTRKRLLEEIEQLARRAIHGTLSESYRTCGNPRCCCHAQGPKHGPHLYISYRGESGKTTGYYVPKAVENEVRREAEACSQLQTQLRRLSALNKERALLLETVDTGTDAASTTELAATVARQGSFKATELVMAPGADLNQCADALRKSGIYLEGAANFVPA